MWAALPAAEVMAPLPGAELSPYIPGRCNEEDCEMLRLSRTRAELDGLRGRMKLTFVGYRKPGPSWPTRHLTELYKVENADAFFALNRRGWRFCKGPIRWLLITDVSDTPSSPYSHIEAISVGFDNGVGAPPNDGQGACYEGWYQAN